MQEELDKLDSTEPSSAACKEWVLWFDVLALFLSIISIQCLVTCVYVSENSAGFSSAWKAYLTPFFLCKCCCNSWQLITHHGDILCSACLFSAAEAQRSLRGTGGLKGSVALMVTNGGRKVRIFLNGGCPVMDENTHADIPRLCHSWAILSGRSKQRNISWAVNWVGYVNAFIKGS